MRFLYLSNPRLGGWLEDLTGITELRGLRLLRLAGWCGSFYRGTSNSIVSRCAFVLTPAQPAAVLSRRSINSHACQLLSSRAQVLVLT